MHDNSGHLAGQGNFAFRQVLALMQNFALNVIPGADEPDEIDWNAFVAHAVYHGVQAMLFERLFQRLDEFPSQIHGRVTNF